MEFEWDADKSARNSVERGFDFEFAANVFLGPVLQREDTRRDYGERRWIVVGAIEGVEFTLVVTYRGEVCRIISAWRANRNEREAYRAALARGSPRS